MKFGWLFVASLLNNTGASFLWPLTTIYLHNYLHESLTLSGLVLLGMSLMMIVGDSVGGYLFDHWKPYETGILSAALATVAVIALIFWHGWPVYGYLLLVIGFGDGVNMTILNSLATRVKTTSTRHVFNLLYVAMNIGVVIGTLIVGYAIKFGITTIFIIAAVCYAALTAVVAAHFNVAPQQHRTDNTKSDVKHSRMPVLVTLILLLLLAINLAYSQWESVISVHMTNLGIPVLKYSLLWTLNGLIIVICQPFVTRWSERFKIENVIVVGITLFAASFFMLIFARTYVAFIITMVVLTFGEMIGHPALPAWIAVKAPSLEAGRYQGFANMAIAFGRALGPLFGGFMLDFSTFSVLFMAVGMVQMIALAAVYLRARRERLRKKRV
ncbi:MDR family MFS transporter [Furfurilactobacillus siliginis]|uniref:MDR family MFS transporter n=1 Tax=Furfurilactobacillus siliginis TaxID=348151 RepID=UPI0021F09443|nr:MFS transporter [Furfurilactobacillus siliginis]